MSARERILARVRDALEDRPRSPHPGTFAGWRPTPPPPAVEGFVATFTRAGGEVAPVADLAAARAWLEDFAQAFARVAVGATVPEALRLPGAVEAPGEADLGVSLALGAVAETGSLVLGAADGRRVQLLPPTHVVIVPTGTVRATLAEALSGLRGDLPSAVGLHSGPSKSADIGQVLVRGVHGPGRVVAVLLSS